MTSMKSVMLEEEGKSAGAETNIPAEVADKSKKKPPARLRILNVGVFTSKQRERCVTSSVGRKLIQVPRHASPLDPRQVKLLRTRPLLNLIQVHMLLPIVRFSPSELLLDGQVHQNLAQGAAQHVKQSHPEPDLPASKR